MRIYPLIKTDRTKEQLFPALMMTVRWTEPRGRQMEIILRSVGPVSRLSTQSRQQKGILVMNGLCYLVDPDEYHMCQEKGDQMRNLGAGATPNTVCTSAQFCPDIIDN